MKQGGKEPEG